jgi:hypothetical protein
MWLVFDIVNRAKKHKKDYYMKFGLKAICFAGVIAASAVYASTILSPNQINNTGNIPSGYSDLTFVLSNGNWVKMFICRRLLTILIK